MISLRVTVAAALSAALLIACSSTSTEGDTAESDGPLSGGGKPPGTGCGPKPCDPQPDPGCGGGKPTPGPGACDAKGACGPALGMPNYLCADGKTVGGPTGRCLDRGGVCGWEVLDCPKPTPCDCGPAPAIAKACADGKSVSPVCKPSSVPGGGCGWVFPDCPPPPPPPPPPGKCDAKGACGPALGMPNYLCPDGKTVAGPTGACLDTGTGCGWEVVSCP
jgi:hypothetical protein